MTITSLKELGKFLNTYPTGGRVADYGGTDAISAGIVKAMLTLDHVEVIDKTDGKTIGDIDLDVKGLPKYKNPEYTMLDFDSGIDLREPIPGEKFDTGICMDLLEHTSNPFLVAKNIIDSLVTGAMLFVTVPWIWEIHNYPSDYWRFTPEGLNELFKEMELRSINIVRDAAPDEELPRSRIVGIYKKL